MQRPSQPSANQVAAATARHPALILAALVAAGVVTAHWSHWTVSVWLWCAGVFCALSAVVSLRPRRRAAFQITICVAAIAISLGGARYSIQTANRPNPGVIELATSGRTVELFGVVDGSPQKRLSGWRVPLALTSLRTRTGTAALESTVLLTARRPIDYLRYGDRVRLPARLALPHIRRNPGGFDYSEHLFMREIDALARPAGEIIRLDLPETSFSLHRFVEPVRQWLRDVFTRHLPRLPRTLILGFLIGETGELPPSVLSTVRDAGVLHLLAVSGANVWLVVGIVLLPLRLLRVHRWPQAIIVVTVVVAFSALARNEPSVVRASLMVGSLFVGSLWYRPVRPFNAVGLSAFVILLVSPTHLFQPGFQLSFAAVISIIVVVGSLRHWTHQPRSRWGRWLLMLCLSTLAATIATAPIIAWHFGEVPIVTLPANLILVPLASLCVYLGIGVLLIDPLWSTAAGLIAVPLAWLLTMCLQVAQLFASLPVAVLRWPNPSPVTIAMLYGGLLAILKWRHRYRFVRPAAYVAGIVLLGSWVMPAMLDTPAQHRLAVLDAGRTLVAVHHEFDADTVVLYTDDPHISYNLREWVIEPYLRQAGLSPVHFVVEPWFTVPRSHQLPIESEADQPMADRLVRYLSQLPGVDGQDRRWADRYSTENGSVTFVRSVPIGSGVTAWTEVTGAGTDVLILPANCPVKVLRSLLGSTSAGDIILYGDDVPHRNATHWFDALRTHYPDKRFWATPIHGGITIEWHPQNLTISPTIANSAWSDPSGR